MVLSHFEQNNTRETPSLQFSSGAEQKALEAYGGWVCSMGKDGPEFLILLMHGLFRLAFNRRA